MGLLIKYKNGIKINKYKNLPTNSLNVFISSSQLRTERVN